MEILHKFCEILENRVYIISIIIFLAFNMGFRIGDCIIVVLNKNIVEY